MNSIMKSSFHGVFLQVKKPQQLDIREDFKVSKGISCLLTHLIFEAKLRQGRY